MAGCQRDFHPPASLTSWAVVSYDHDVGTPAKLQLTFNCAVAASPWVSIWPTCTDGLTGPMPATSAASSWFTSVLLAPANSTEATSFLANPAASSAAARAALSSTGDGVGTVPPRVHPPASKTIAMTTATIGLKRTGLFCRVFPAGSRPLPGSRLGLSHQARWACWLGSPAAPARSLVQTQPALRYPTLASVSGRYKRKAAYGPVMGIYAQRPGKLIGQLVADLMVLLWGVAWALVGNLIHQMISMVAVPAKETSRAAGRLAENFHEAAEQAANVPGVGEQLRRPFDAAAGTMGGVVASADHQVANIEQLATVTGWLVFLIPVSVVVAFWLPRRIRFWQQSRAAQRFIDSDADLDLFALRAMAREPMHVLAAISDDPVGAWRSGDSAVITKLAEIELGRSGLHLPARLRARTG
jgi:hypothetical protein